MRSGQAFYDIDCGRFAVGEEGYLILNHEQPSTIDIASPTGVESFCVFFPPGWVEDVRRGMATSDVDLLDDQRPDYTQSVSLYERIYPHDTIVSPRMALLETAVRLGYADAGYLEEQLRLLLAGMLQLQVGLRREIAQLPASREATRTELYRRLYRTRDYMHACLGESRTIDDIAAIAAPSPYHFIRSFKALFRQTPHAYLTHCRLQRPRFLLTRTDLPVTHICFDVGFESPGSFSILCRQKTGLSPRAYRKTYSKPR